MKLVIVTQWVQIPPEQRLATSSEVKSEGKTSNGGPKPGVIEGAGSVLNSERCIIVVRQDKPV
jgi:hypothetical protein